MSLHADPTTVAERLARHLEVNYALQLDSSRHQALVREIDLFITQPLALPVAKPRKPKKEKR